MLLETLRKSPKAIATFALCSANSLVFDKINTYGSLRRIKIIFYLIDKSIIDNADKLNTAVLPVPL